jgi:hypothetical protein
LTDLLSKCLAEQPTALIIDLDGLQAVPLSILSTFGVVSRAAAVWSGVPILLVAAGQMNSDLHSAVLGHHVGVYQSLQTAMESTRTAPTRRVAEWHLRGEPRSAGFARQKLRETCTAWSQQTAAEDFVLLANELVSNGIRESSGAGLELRAELRENQLTVAVTDRTSTSPPRPNDDSLDRRIITAVATTWGSSRTLSGGKTTWAVLQLAP